MSGPLVSVIVPTYNRLEMLSDCLASIQRQTYDNIEIIVVNDSGVDVEEVIRLSNGKNNIASIIHPYNKGMAAARNTGIKHAKGKYIAYLDDDDIYYPDHVRILVEYLENSHFQVAYTDAVRVILRAEDEGCLMEKMDVPYSFEFDRDRMLISNYIPTLCIMHEVSCLEKTGLFDDSLTAHEDWDLWIRMSRVFEFAHICERTCEFRLRIGAPSVTSDRRGEFVRTLLLIHDRYSELSRDRPDILREQNKFVRKQQLLLKMWDILDKMSGLSGKRRQFFHKIKKHLV